MKTKATFLFLLLCLCQLAQAQTQDSVFYRHHIGLNTRVVLDRIADPVSRTPLQLIYKYQLSPKSAIRVMAEGFYAKSDSSQTLTNRVDEVTHYTYGGSMGYEQQSPLSRTFMLYYGADVFYRRDGRNIEINNRYAEPFPSQYISESYIEDKLFTTSVGLMPFVGLRANIGSRFYLSTEATLSLRREKSLWDYKYYIKSTLPDGSSSTQPGYTDFEVNRTVISFLPFSGINLQYLF